MKTIDKKSILIGAFATILFLSLTSSKKSDTDTNFEFVTLSTGLGIYDKSANLLHMYKMPYLYLDKNPYASYIINDNGASLTEIKSKK